jgi:hypothetical protein
VDVDLRNDPDLSASNAAWSRTERRCGEGHHLRARPSSSTAGGETRVPSRATRCPSRLLILFERQRRYSEIGERLLEGLPSVARRPIFGGRSCLLRLFSTWRVAAASRAWLQQRFPARCALACRGASMYFKMETLRQNRWPNRPTAQPWRAGQGPGSPWHSMTHKGCP